MQLNYFDYCPRSLDGTQKIFCVLEERGKNKMNQFLTSQYISIVYCDKFDSYRAVNIEADTDPSLMFRLL